MASQQTDDIQEVKLDVALIKNDIKTMKRDMAGNQKVIIDRMDKFAFVTQKDHDRDMHDLRKEYTAQIEDLKAEIKPFIDQAQKDSKLVNAGGLKISNTIFGNVTRIFLTAFAIGIVIITVGVVISTVPAAQSALGNVK